MTRLSLYAQHVFSGAKRELLAEIIDAYIDDLEYAHSKLKDAGCLNWVIGMICVAFLTTLKALYFTYTYIIYLIKKLRK